MIKNRICSDGILLKMGGMNENINLLNIMAGYIKIIIDFDVFNPSVND